MDAQTTPKRLPILGAIGIVKEFGKRQTVSAIAANELYTAQVELLQAQANAEHWHAIASMLEKRVARLHCVVGAQTPEDCCAPGVLSRAESR